MDESRDSLSRQEAVEREAAERNPEQRAEAEHFQLKQSGVRSHHHSRVTAETLPSILIPRWLPPTFPVYARAHCSGELAQ